MGRSRRDPHFLKTRRALAGEDIKASEPLPVEAVKKRHSFNPLQFFRRLSS
jgi:hypothetical protein